MLILVVMLNNIILNKLKKIVFLVSCLFLVIVLSGCSQDNQPSTEEVVGLPPGNILFISKTCPHCAVVKQYIDENNVLQKIYFVSRDITSDQVAYKLLPIIGQKCGLSSNNLGVPLFWDGQKCYSGEREIINYFKALP